MQMFRAKCASCQHIYDVAVTPMTVDKFVRIAMHSACKMCGNQRGNTCAPSRDLTPGEIAHQTTVPAPLGVTTNLTEGYQPDTVPGQPPPQNPPNQGSGAKPAPPVSLLSASGASPPAAQGPTGSPPAREVQK